MEVAHGMPTSFIGKGGWRGEHATNLKTTSSWGEDGNGINSLGLNILLAGYYFSKKISDGFGLEGLGFSAAYWSATKDNVGWARFLFSSRKFVNKWNENINDLTGTALTCRCLND